MYRQGTCKQRLWQLYSTMWDPGEIIKIHQNEVWKGLRVYSPPRRLEAKGVFGVSPSILFQKWIFTGNLTRQMECFTKPNGFISHVCLGKGPRENLWNVIGRTFCLPLAGNSTGLLFGAWGDTRRVSPPCAEPRFWAEIN